MENTPLGSRMNFMSGVFSSKKSKAQYDFNIQYFIDYFPNPIMQCVFGGSLHKSNTSYLL